MSEKRYIVGMQTIKTVKNAGARKMLDLLMVSSLLILGGYSLWFFFKAKTFQSLTLDDLALTWKLHKQQTGCKASRLHSLFTKNNNVVGFKCDCGHEFLQKRLIAQKVHTYAQTSRVPLISSKVAGQLQNLGLHYSHIKKIQLHDEVFPIKAPLSVKKESYNEFKKVLLKAIDESLNKVLGGIATQTIYFYFGQEHHLKPEDIPDSLENFLFTLERIFGIGALIIEKIIMENLYSRLSLNNKNLSFKYKNKEQIGFINYVNDLKKLTICTREEVIQNHALYK